MIAKGLLAFAAAALTSVACANSHAEYTPGLEHAFGMLNQALTSATTTGRAAGVVIVALSDEQSLGDASSGIAMHRKQIVPVPVPVDVLHSEINSKWTSSCQAVPLDVTNAAEVSAIVPKIAMAAKAECVAVLARIFDGAELSSLSKQIESETGVAPFVIQLAGHAEAGSPRGRMLAGVATAATVGIYMMPSIVEGLLVGLLLLFFVFVGLYCIFQIRTPDVLHSTALPAGKEY